MINFLKKFHLILVLSTLIIKAASCTPLPPPNFADVVAPLLSSVVNISTVTEISRNRMPMEMPNFPPGSPMEEIFRRFLEEGPQLNPRKTTSLGSGFIVSQEGEEVYIATCNHVIEVDKVTAEKITVILHDNSEYVAKVVGRDPRTDIALLKIKTDKKLKTIEWGNSDTSRVGEWVIAIGNPFGLSSTVTEGIISTIMRDLSMRAPGMVTANFIEGFIQTNASINMGNSGGPMFDMNQKVIGINNAILSPNGGSIGIGFAIPSAIAKSVIEQLKKHGRTKRGWLGVKIQAVTEEIAISLGLKKAMGALVGDISPTSPAIKAGIKSGDVILNFNNQEIKESRFLPRIAGDSPIGSKVPIIVWRNGKELKLEIIVGEFEQAEKDGLILSENGEEERKTTKSSGKQILGLGLQSIKAPLYERFGVTEDTRGLVITYVSPDSEAAEKGLRVDDMIAEIRLESIQERVTEPERFAQIIETARKNKKKSILLLITRNKESRYIVLSLEEEKDVKNSEK